MERLLDFSQPIDVALLEQVVRSMNTSGDPSVQGRANAVLTALKEHEHAWQSAGTVLETSQDMATRYYALQVLEDAIKFRWRALPAEQREGIRNYVVKKIIDTASVDGFNADRGKRLFVSKLNLILVQVLKQEWPQNWPNFIPEIVGSSRSSEVLCENNMHVLRLLSEEVFDFSKEEMTSDKVKLLKQQFNAEFRGIFELCQMVLSQSSRPSLVLVTLQTLLRFLAWIPLGYIFETALVQQLLSKFLPNVQFRNDALACLTEIAGLEAREYDAVFQNLYVGVMNILQQQLPPDTDIPAEFSHASERECTFIRGLSLFLSTFFGKHAEVLERAENHAACVTGMFYLVSISMVDDKEIFKICLEFWNKFAKDLYDAEVGPTGPDGITPLNPPPPNLLQLGAYGAASHALPRRSARKDLFATVLSRVRAVMISKMAKPEEVLIVEDEDGSIVRETTKDTDAIAQYKTMRDTLVYLTHLDNEDTENIMLSKLAAQCDEASGAFTWHNLNTLCWAIGSISGAMNIDDEKRFLVTVIRDLLSLCEMKRGKDNKAVVASNIMYVVGQYPRFLRAYWKFLKTVVNKLFEFMHELHPGVQDMACDTFLKIAQKCKGQFVVLHPTEQTPFIDELLRSIQNIVRDLSPHQRYTFYEAVGYMIKEQPVAALRTQLLEQLMQPYAQQWRELMALGAANPAQLGEQGAIATLADILRVNTAVCSAMGYAFRPHLMGFYLDMLHVYKFYSEQVSHQVAQGGAVVIQHKQIKLMRAVKLEVLKLIAAFVEQSEVEADIANNFTPPLIEPLLGDYQNSMPAARNAEVLGLFATIVAKVGAPMAQALDGTMVEKVLQPLFHPTLEMITANFTDFPEHRLQFYRLLKALNQSCFERLFSVPQDTQKNIIDAIVWAFKHTERTIAELGLEILDKLLSNVAAAPDSFAQPFYQAYLLSLLQDVLYVLTDRLHKTSFSMQCGSLRQLFGAVQQARVKVPLSPQQQQPAPQGNQAFLQGYVGNMIAQAFPNVARIKVEQFVVGLFDPSKDPSAFKAHMRDFLITIKEFSSDNDQDLFAADKEEQQRAQQHKQLQQRAAIPGLLTQQEMQEMQDL